MTHRAMNAYIIIVYNNNNDAYLPTFTYVLMVKTRSRECNILFGKVSFTIVHEILGIKNKDNNILFYGRVPVV